MLKLKYNKKYEVVDKMKKTRLLNMIPILMIAIVLMPVVTSESPGGGNFNIISTYASTRQTNSIYSTNDDVNDDVLVIVYNYRYENDVNTHNLEKVLTDLGYTVTALYRPAEGVIASTLASGDYDQVYLWDITSQLGLTSDEDKNALATWYSSHRGNIVIDGRSYGIYFDISRDKNLIQNIAEAFAHRGGGLWIGTDHTPSWARNGNALLTALGYGTISGVHYSPITGGDTGCELLTTPNTITPTAMWVGTVGKAPTGVQSDGVDLKPLMWSYNTTYISYALEPLGPALPEFGSLAVALTILLTAPAFAYLIVKKRNIR